MTQPADQRLAERAEAFEQGSVAWANDPEEFEHQITMTPDRFREFMATHLSVVCPFPVHPRRPYSDEKPAQYLESDRDFFENNREAVLWFLQQMGAETA